MKYELVVFDWDGTLLDSAAAIVHAIQASAADLGLAPPDEWRARHVIGLGLVDALAHAVPDLTPDRYGEMVARYRHHYLSSDHELSLFAGIPDLLDELLGRGHILAVATGKSRVGLERALDHSGLRPRFMASRCADECHSKPHPQMLEELLEEFAVAPEVALMIGDTTHDLLMARNAGVDALAVTYGAHARPQLLDCTPQACVDTVAEMAEWLRRCA